MEDGQTGAVTYIKSKYRILQTQEMGEAAGVGGNTGEKDRCKTSTTQFKVISRVSLPEEAEYVFKIFR